jgi:hydroxylamine dehydrogenase
VNYNEKFGKPGQKIITELRNQKLITPQEFDEEIEWTWFYLWHHEGRRARHGASMMAPDYAHWHGMYEVAERFYQQLIPQAREITDQADEADGDAVRKVIDDILARPEHQWFEGPNQTPPPSTAPAGNVNPTGTGDSPPPGKKSGD